VHRHKKSERHPVSIGPDRPAVRHSATAHTTGAHRSVSLPARPPVERLLDPLARKFPRIYFFVLAGGARENF